jgi:multiple sugar transport system ATP-binding protein
VELRKLQQELGVTAIFVTHDQIEAMTIGDRIAVMNQGHLEQMGTPAELYHNPRNRFVAGFIGSPPMNMLEGRLEERNGEPVVDLGFCIYELPKKAGELMEKTASSGVILGVRPENIVIAKEIKRNSLEATVVHIELTGKESNVHLEAGTSSLIAIRNSTQDLRVGDEVWLSFDEEKIHVFDQESGEALL